MEKESRNPLAMEMERILLRLKKRGSATLSELVSTTAGDPTILSETRTRNALYFLLTENAEVGEPLIAHRDVQDESGRAVGKYELTKRGMEATRTLCET